ncbi:hypothetical protein M9Y10_037993 [Tritrichomonas musculus]|uniref:AAA+ ATPase domain-containing protein n=1 Tax=Tritrichomonas musculus TaxID=1915356 RepID=A0ABR2K759_9EUKA
MASTFDKNQAIFYYDAGRKSLTQAVNMEKIRNYMAAKTFYLQARSQFNLALSCDPQKVQPIKAILTEFLNKCNERIDAIDNIKVSSPARHSGGSSGNNGSGGNSNNNDSDPSEFKDRISSAILIEKPNVHFSDVAGLHVAKSSLEEAVILPLRMPQLFTGERAPWHGILLYGPPGTGKSYLAKAIATEADNSTFLTVSTSDLVSKWVGESEKLIRALFDLAREKKPSIIFIDEIDSLLSNRSDQDTEASRRIKTEFLVQIDGVGKSMDGVLLLAATNLPWDLDPAVRRRFEKKIYIPLPDFEARKYLIGVRVKGTPNNLSDNDLSIIAQNTEGYSGSDLKILTREASFVSLRNLQQAQYFAEYQGMWWPCNPDQPGAVHKNWKELDPKKIHPPLMTVNDFMVSLQKVRPSVAQSDLKKYEDWTNEFGQEGC